MKRGNIFLILILLFLITIPLTTSLIGSDLGTFQINSEIQLYQNCENCTFVNISSVKLPNGTILFYNEAMTKNAQDYTFSFNQTSLEGDYFYNVCGNKDGELECEDITFTMTKSGYKETTSGSILYFILIIFVLAFFGLCLFGALSLPFKNTRDEEGSIIFVNKLKYLKITCFALSYLMLIWLANLLFALSNNFNVLSQYTKFFEVIFRILVSLGFPLFVVTLIIFVSVAIRDSKIKKLLKSGFKGRYNE